MSVKVCKTCSTCEHDTDLDAIFDQSRCAGCFVPVRANYKFKKGCFNCFRSLGGKRVAKHEALCWACDGLSNWWGDKTVRYDGDDWVDNLIESNGRQELFRYDPKVVDLHISDPVKFITNHPGYEEIVKGEKVIAKCVRPKYTLWKQTTVHKRIKASARRSRRVFKQYLKTGSLRLLEAAERKVTSWDFD